METFLYVNIVFFFSQFKSYYVVWKLHMTENKNIAQAKFKSYYVVWKPVNAGFFVSKPKPFKSYYVVWKHAFLTAPATIPTSLNRTM